MKIISSGSIEYTEVNFSDLYGDMRIDSQYYDPFFIRNAEKIESKSHKKIKDFMSVPQYGLSIAMNEDEIGYKMLKMDDIIGLLASDEKAKYADISTKVFNQFRLNKFDVLFNRVNSDDFVGRTGIYLLDGEHTFASYLVKISSNHTYQNCYLTAFLNSKYGFQVLQRVKRRSVNQANINAKELQEITVPYPSIEFQKEIERLLIESNSLKNGSLNYYNEAEKVLFKELGIANWKNETIDIEFNNTVVKSIKAVNFGKTSSINDYNRMDGAFWLPKYVKAEEYLSNDGRSSTLLELASVVKGVQARGTGNGSVPYVSIKDCNNLSVETEEYTNLNKVILAQPNDILMAVTGATIGKVALNDSNRVVAISGDLIKISPKSISPYYLLAVLASPLIRDLAIRYTTGATNGHLAPKDISKFPVPIIAEDPLHEVQKNVEMMFTAKSHSKNLLKVATKAVELYVEKDEKAGLEFIKNNQ